MTKEEADKIYGFILKNEATPCMLDHPRKFYKDFTRGFRQLKFKIWYERSFQ